jgi:hypothetical protein
VSFVPSLRRLLRRHDRDASPAASETASLEARLDQAEAACRDALRAVRRDLADAVAAGSTTAGVRGVVELQAAEAELQSILDEVVLAHRGLVARGRVATAAVDVARLEARANERSRAARRALQESGSGSHPPDRA